MALAYFGEDVGTMLALVDRARTLNPSFARGSYISGILRLWSGQPDLAIECAEASLRLSPRGRFGSPFWVIGTAHFLSRRFDEALATLLVVVQEIPTFPMLLRTLASCYAHMGRLEDAREVVKRLRDITPIVVPSVTPLQNPAHRELFLSGLRQAAGAET
jgi:pentatricopeptide repeat protein